jgi:hypothetical protein
MRRHTLLIATIVAVTVVVAVHAFDFPGSVPRFEKVSGGGVLLDAIPAFSVDDVYARLSGYGEEGRASYAFRNLTVDVLLPLSVLPVLFLIARRAGASWPSVSAFRLVLLAVPFVYVVFDLAENGLVLSLLSSYPDRQPAVAAVLPYVTSIKRVASLLAIVVPLSILGTRAVREKRLAAAS